MSTLQPDPLDTLTGIPVASQEYATGILGPGFIGWGFQLLTYGIAANMLLNYARSPLYQRDSTRTKIVLWCTMLAASSQTALSFNAMFHYGTEQHRDAVTLYAQTYPDCFITLPTAISGAFVQTFFVSRASKLIHVQVLRILFLLFSGLLIVASLLGGFAFVVISFLDKNGKPVPELFDFNVTTGLWLVGGASADIVVTGCLVFILRKNIHGFNKNTDSIMRQLIKLAIETASYTTIFAICAAVLSFSFRDGSTTSNSALAFYPRERIKATPMDYTLPTVITTNMSGIGASDQIERSALNQHGTRRGQTFSRPSFVSQYPHRDSHEDSTDLSAAQRAKTKMVKLFSLGGVPLSLSSSSGEATDGHQRHRNKRDDDRKSYSSATGASDKTRSGGTVSQIRVDESIEVVTESTSDVGDEDHKI
ncbi:hypothetical protein OIO90_004949 [Microbotryomycetes sp. JL221]|nr:hypothetical protein OIO90_004949 [Microbotryomycetes sp. JL221]